MNNLTVSLETAKQLKEEWKSIEGFEGVYEVSNLGRVKRSKTQKILKQAERGKYLCVDLSRNNISKTFSVHRLVALAFIPLIKGLDQVNHIDGNKFNNHYSNLEWCNPSTNKLHSFRIGTTLPTSGERNGRSKLKESQVIEIIKLLDSGIPSGQIAIRYHVAHQTISDIKNNKRWSYLKKEKLI